jgi:hypothetical protein
MSDRAKDLIERLASFGARGKAFGPGAACMLSLKSRDVDLLLAALRLAEADDAVDACPLGCAAREFAPLERTHALTAYHAAKEK